MIALAVAVDLVEPEAGGVLDAAAGRGAEQLRLHPLGEFAQVGGHRIVGGGRHDAEHDRACQRRRDELPGGNAGGARDHEFEPPRQREVAGHRADQDAERHQLFEQLRHAEQRRLRDHDRGCRNQARGLAHHFDVIDQHQQHEDAGKHAHRRDHEAAGEITPERVGHHAHAVAGRPKSRASRAFDLLIASISAAGGSTTMPPRIIQRPTRDRRRTASRYCTSAAAGDLHRHDRAGESGHAQAEHREDRAADRKIAALARGARRAEKRKGQRREGKRIDRRHEAIMQFGAELAATAACTSDRLPRARSVPTDSVREFPA